MPIDLDLTYTDTANFEAVPDWSNPEGKRQATHTFYNALIQALLDSKGLFEDAETAINLNEANIDVLLAGFAGIDGISFNERLAADLPTAFADGLSMGFVNTGGWPGTGVGAWWAFRKASDDNIVQFFFSNSGTTYVRHGTADAWPHPWGSFGGHIEPIALATAITSYPQGLSSMPVLLSNGWPSNGQIITNTNSAGSGVQIHLSSTGSVISTRGYPVAGPWTAFSSLATSTELAALIADVASLENEDVALNAKLDHLGIFTPQLGGTVTESIAKTSAIIINGNDANTFRGWGAPVGDHPQTYNGVEVAIKTNATPITQIRLIIREDNKTGTILADKTIAYPQAAHLISYPVIQLDTPITDASDLYLQIAADSAIAHFGVKLTSPHTYANGTYKTSAQAITSNTWADVNAGVYDPMTIWCRFGTVSADYGFEPSQELIDALSGVTSGGVSSSEAVVNTYRLRDYADAVFSKVNSGSTLIKIAVVGDSLSARPTASGGYFQELSKMLFQEYGFGGAGWITNSTDATKGGQPTDLFSTVVTNGGDVTFVDESGSKGLHAGHTLLGVSGSTGFVQVVSLFENAAIHYISQSGGGTFRYQVDGGSWTSVNTNAAELLTVINITGLTRAVHTLRIEAVSGVSMIAGEFLTTGAGICLSNFSNGSSDTADYAPLSETQPWRDSLASIAPNVVLIAHGTNDMRNDIPLTTYTDNIDVICQSVRVARAKTDIVLLSPEDNNVVATNTMGELADALRSYATTNNECHVSIYKLFGPFADADSRGWMDGLAPAASFHKSTEGGKAEARMLFKEVFRLPEYRRPITVIAFHTNGTAALSLTNLPAALQRLNNTVRFRTQMDLSPYKQIRIVTEHGTAAATTTSRFFCRWATTPGGTYTIFGSGAADATDVINLDTQNDKTDWVEIVDAAKTDVYLDLASEGGSGAETPTITALFVQLR